MPAAGIPITANDIQELCSDTDTWTAHIRNLDIPNKRIKSVVLPGATTSIPAGFLNGCEYMVARALARIEESH